MDAAVAVVVDPGRIAARRAEIRRALETIGCAPTAKQIYSCCPAFADEAELRRELFAMSQEGLVRLVSEVAPARYALTGKEGAPPKAAVPPPMKVESTRGVDDADDMPPVQIRRTVFEQGAPVFPVVPAGPAPAAQPKEPVMPKTKTAKPARAGTQEAVLEALKASRDPLILSEIVAATRSKVQTVKSALATLQRQGEIHVAGYLDGNKHKSQYAIGKGQGAPKGKKQQPKAAKSQRGAAVPSGPAQAGGADVRIWLSSFGSMRLEKGEQVLDLTQRDAVALKAFMVKLAAIAT